MWPRSWRYSFSCSRRPGGGVLTGAAHVAQSRNAPAGISDIPPLQTLARPTVRNDRAGRLQDTSGQNDRAQWRVVWVRTGETRCADALLPPPHLSRQLATIRGTINNENHSGFGPFAYGGY
jgi:hypothetical protein